MNKEAIAETLENIARLLDLKGENVFKIRAYQTAARAVETYAGNLEETRPRRPARARSKASARPSPRRSPNSSPPAGWSIMRN